MLVALHHLFTSAVILIAVALNSSQNVMAVSAAAFALPPSGVSSNKVLGAIVNDGEENIEWMDDWMLRFGGVARYEPCGDMRRDVFSSIIRHTFILSYMFTSNLIFQIVRKQG